MPQEQGGKGAYVRVASAEIVDAGTFGTLLTLQEPGQGQERHSIAVDRYTVPEENVAIHHKDLAETIAGWLGAIKIAGEIAGAGAGLGADQHGEEEGREPVTRPLAQSDGIQGGANGHRQVL